MSSTGWAGVVDVVTAEELGAHCDHCSDPIDRGDLVAVLSNGERVHDDGCRPGDREPHAVFFGDPGTGKTEAMKVLSDSLLQGALVAIIDPKQQDFAEYLGRPGIDTVPAHQGEHR